MHCTVTALVHVSDCLVLPDLGAEAPLKKEENLHEEDTQQVAQLQPQTLPRPSPREQHHRRRSSVVHLQEGRWSAVNAAVVWQRMLCILGDVNSIENPIIHYDVMICLWEVWKMLKAVGVGTGRGGVAVNHGHRIQWTTINLC